MRMPKENPSLESLNPKPLKLPVCGHSSMRLFLKSRPVLSGLKQWTIIWKIKWIIKWNLLYAHIYTLFRDLGFV